MSQTSWPAATAGVSAEAALPPRPGGTALPSASAEAAAGLPSLPVAVPPSPTASKVEDLIGSFRGAGSIRRHAADYAIALMAHDRLPEAPHILDDALGNAGSEPSEALLLLLRGHCLQSVGQPGPALKDLLKSTETDPELLPSAAPRLQRLLLSAEAGESRTRILTSWGPALEERVSSQNHLLLCVIELQAAVLQHDTGMTDAVVGRIRRAHAEAGTARCSEMLAWIRSRAPADGRLFETLARTDARLGLMRDAITDIDRAIQLGLGEPGAAAALLEFKAEIVSGQGQDAQATGVLREAGESAYLQNDSETAARLLRQVWAAEPDAETGWILADALRVRGGELPASQFSLLLEALDVASKAADLGAVAGRLAWGHSVLAQIRLNLADQEPLAGRHHVILGALEAERRLLLEDDVATLAQLTEAYRRLEWHALSADAAARCRAQLEDRPDVLWSLAYAQLETGTDTKETFGAMQRHPQTTDLQRAVIYFVLGQDDEALAAFRGQLDALEDDPAIRLVYARLLRRLGRQAAARAEFEAVQKQAEVLPEQELSSADRAFTRYLLQDYGPALDLLQPAIKAGEACSYSPADVYGTAMLCHFALGNLKHAVEARGSLLAGLRGVYVGNEIAAELDHLRHGTGLSRAVVSEIERTAELISAAVTRIHNEGLDLDSALGRLRPMAHTDSSREATAATSALVTMASSRLLLQRGRWKDAGQACLALLSTDTEDAACADAALDRLFVAVDTMLRGGASAAALSILQDAMPNVSPRRRHEVMIRIVLAHPDDQAEAVRSLHDMDAEMVANVLQAIAPDVETMYRIAARTELARLPALDEALLRIAEDALHLNRDEEAGNPAPQILVEIGTGLFTTEPSPDGPLFRTQLPALRERVERLTGVRLPAVLIRAVPEFPPMKFQVSVAGQPPEAGLVQPGMVYVRQSSKQVGAALGGDCQIIPAMDPVSGKESCWVSYDRAPLLRRLSARWKGAQSQPPHTKAAWTRFLTDTGTWDDPLSYPLAVLEKKVMAGLSYLVTVDDMAAAVDRWCQGAGIDLDTHAVYSGLARLTALGHDLLDEGIALIPRAGSGAELERILDAGVSYPQALAVARDIFMTQLPGGAGR